MANSLTVSMIAYLTTCENEHQIICDLHSSWLFKGILNYALLSTNLSGLKYLESRFEFIESWLC